jgi:hypothetical protein
MKRKLLSILLIGVLVFGVTGCGNKVESNNNNGNENNNQQVDTVKSIRDNSIYFVTINGKTFKAGDKLSSVSEAGLKLKEKDLDTTIPKNRYLMAKSVLNADGKEVVDFVALNDTDDTIKYQDAVIGGFEVGEYNTSKVSEETKAANIEIVGGIKLGSTVDDIHRVFGDEDFKHEYEGNEQLKMPKYTTYKYSSGYKGFEFIVDDSGKVSQISWHNYNYNEN